MVFDIALIPPNSFDIDITDPYDTDSIKNIINEKISNLISFIPVISPQNMIENIIETLEMSEDSMGHTKTCFENKNNIYQICFKQSVVNPNKLSELLIYDDETPHENCILIKNSISTNHDVFNSSITNHDIINIIHDRIIHTCVLVKYNGETHNIKFTNFDKKFISTINYIGFNFNIYENINANNNKEDNKDNKEDNKDDDKEKEDNKEKDDNKNINKLASILFKKNIYEDVYITLNHPNGDFMNIDSELFKTVISSIELNDNFSMTDEETEFIKSSKYINQYHVLNKRLYG